MRFKYVPHPHDAAILSDALGECLIDWNIDNKKSTVTVNNCATNDAMILLLKDKLHSSCFLLDGKLFHMRCCAHILNLIIKDGLSVIGDSVDRIRDSITYWTTLVKRYEKFEETTRMIHVQYIKKLTLNCVTSWNSTYLVLSTALLYKNVFTRCKLRDSRYRGAPSEDDWVMAQSLCDKLVLFYKITKLFS
ncbi:Ribonuclease H-like domain containing protein [Trema orientale]|uniref:Ribonuclease H-like domain containing protein n=1 Tax=Trema orientale TaxID=63057 RepID=A0A2P5EN43_TREOI|nr:Ribonuclease H-like domain containing protein [Trema orientale]